jgi:hypothetical protein
MAKEMVVMSRQDLVAFKVLNEGCSSSRGKKSRNMGTRIQVGRLINNPDTNRMTALAHIIPGLRV